MSRTKEAMPYDEPDFIMGPSENDDHQAYLWHCLCELRDFMAPEMFAQVEKNLGLEPVAPYIYAPPVENESLPF